MSRRARNSHSRLETEHRKQRDLLLAYIQSCLDISIASVAVPYMTTSLMVIILMAFSGRFNEGKEMELL